MVTKQMTPFFSSTFRSIGTFSSVGIFHFCNLRPSKFSFMGSPSCIMFWSVKYTQLHAKDETSKPINMDIIFLHKTFGI